MQLEGKVARAADEAVELPHQHAVDLGFASQRWQGFVVKRRSKPGTLDRRALRTHPELTALIAVFDG